MFSFTIRLFLATLLFTLSVKAEKEPLLTLDDVPHEVVEVPVVLDQQSFSREIIPPEKYKPIKIWGAIPAGLIGFGAGHALQGRFTAARIPAVFDGAVLFYTIGSLGGHCGELTGETPEKIQKCNDKKRRNFNNIGQAMIVSRLIQVIDLSIWSVKYYKKFHATAFILPNEKGQQLTLAFEF